MPTQRLPLTLYFLFVLFSEEEKKKLLDFSLMILIKLAPIPYSLKPNSFSESTTKLFR